MFPVNPTAPNSASFVTDSRCVRKPHHTRPGSAVVRGHPRRPRYIPAAGPYAGNQRCNPLPVEVEHLQRAVRLPAGRTAKATCSAERVGSRPGEDRLPPAPPPPGRRHGGRRARNKTTTPASQRTALRLLT